MQESAERQVEICRKLQIFSNRLKARRERLGWSQELLAEKSRLSVRSIVAWEQGKNLPQGIKLNRAASALSVPASWLLGEDETEIVSPAIRIAPGKNSAASGGMYAMRDEVKGSPQPPTKQDCHAHLEKFLETCENDPGKIAWTKVELQENLPLNKWKS